MTFKTRISGVLGSNLGVTAFGAPINEEIKTITQKS